MSEPRAPEDPAATLTRMGAVLKRLRRMNAYLEKQEAYLEKQEPFRLLREHGEPPGVPGAEPGSEMSDAEFAEYQREVGRLGGLKGGRARAQKLTPTERSAIARGAAQARWRRVKKKTERPPPRV
jgi:hypothetical protein